jgi:alpha-beta hydrolase superfamily lysophospholipase
MIKKSLTMIQAECLPFGIHSNYIEAYRSYYQLSFSDCNHDYGYVEAGVYQLFVQKFTPISPIGTILLIHGYLDHAGSLNRTIQFLVEHQYQVICYDLPGHGLSSGERATINQFEDYIESLQAIYDKVLRECSNQPILVAHSTGAMIGLVFAERRKESFTKIALIAPLFRPHLWNVSKIGLFITKPFTSKIKRVFQRNSSDHKYLSFTKKDPLQEKQLPISWLYALQSWLRTNKSKESVNTSFLMIQGDLDQTVDMKYGLKRVLSLYPKSKVILMENGHHQLLNEGPIVRNQTFSILLKYLQEKDDSKCE